MRSTTVEWQLEGHLARRRTQGEAPEAEIQGRNCTSTIMKLGNGTRRQRVQIEELETGSVWEPEDLSTRARVDMDGLIIMAKFGGRRRLTESLPATD